LFSVLIITNIGQLVTGDVNRPLIQADTVVVDAGRITAIGDRSLPGESATVIDANGLTVAPGLIDSHIHPVLGDFTPRQLAVNYLESEVHGGVTSMISAGEAHAPGRPSDPAGAKALAVLAHKSFEKVRPGGAKVHGGAMILVIGLVEDDFRELAASGVWLVGEIGLGNVHDPAVAAPMVQWAKKYGMKVQMHTGGTSLPGSSTVTAADVMMVNPTVVSHLNGGPTAIPLVEVDKLIDETGLPLEMVQCGNPKVMDYAVRRLAANGGLARVIIGNDAPSGTGVIPLGILKTLTQIASLSDIPPEVAIAMATGNTARVYGLNTGVIAPGREADLILLDAPMGSVGTTALEAMAAGDLPAVAMVIVDGQLRVNKSRNTPPPKRLPKGPQ